jgi:DNA-binding NarL/FixJ family response regulator
MADQAASHALTGRERDVARLLAAGQSNQKIADTLTIAEGTDEVHVQHILNKLGFGSRTEVARWWLAQRDCSPEAERSRASHSRHRP